MYNKKHIFGYITGIINNREDSKNGHFSAGSAICVYSAFMNGHYYLVIYPFWWREIFCCN